MDNQDILFKGEIVQKKVVMLALLCAYAHIEAMQSHGRQITQKPVTHKNDRKQAKQHWQTQRKQARFEKQQTSCISEMRPNNVTVVMLVQHLVHRVTQGQ